MNVAFGFSFFGQAQTTAFVNSDGNVTFEQEDRASTDRNVARLLTGPPRIAPFLADLDPSTGTGRVFGHAAADQYTVTWCGVRGFDSTRTTNAQLTLLPDGSIEMKFGTVTLAEAIVGLSPGRTGEFVPVDLSANGPTGGGGGAVGERFAEQAQLDTVEVARKFYQSHPDNYDQLVIWTDTTVVDDAFAYEVTVANEIRGIGLSQFDASRDFGSAGRLRSYAVMDWIGKYPEDPLQVFLGENSTVSVLGQEVGHRWLAFLEFRNHTGARSEALLGRDQAHWSFFMDSDASVMEGNDIEDLGGGSFRTTGAVQRYSRLDQYAMGLVSPSQVPTFFYVENPGQRLRRTRGGFRAAGRGDVQRHAPGRPHRGRHRHQRSAHPVGGRLGTRPPPGVPAGRRTGTVSRQRADRQDRPDSQGVGELLPAGHRRPHAGGDGVAVAQSIILLPHARYPRGRCSAQPVTLRFRRRAC